MYFLYFVTVPIILFKKKSIKDNYNINLNIIKFSSRYLFVFFSIALVLFLMGDLKILNRATNREGVLNYNTSFFDFIGSFLSYFIIFFNSFNFSKYLFSQNRFNLLAAAIGSSLLFFLTGTRWLFILSLSPIIIYVLMITKIRNVIIFVPILFVFSLFIAIIRSGSAELTLFSAFYWDVPSFQSYYIVEKYPSEIIKGFQSFVNGNILILIPRFLWHHKPEDFAIVDYMRKELGTRYDEGATVLPGLIGSFHLYGGILFTLLILLPIRMLLSWLNKALMETGSYRLFSFASVIVIGIILQFRGISIAYFLPGLLQIIWILILNNEENRVF